MKRRIAFSVMVLVLLVFASSSIACICKDNTACYTGNLYDCVNGETSSIQITAIYNADFCFDTEDDKECSTIEGLQMCTDFDYFDVLYCLQSPPSYSWFTVVVKVSGDSC